MSKTICTIFSLQFGKIVFSLSFSLSNLGRFGGANTQPAFKPKQNGICLAFLGDSYIAISNLNKGPTIKNEQKTKAQRSGLRKCPINNSTQLNSSTTIGGVRQAHALVQRLGDA